MTFKNNKRKNLLIITCSGGGGHLRAAEAKKIETIINDSTTNVIQKDILIDYIGKRFGKVFCELWNISQKKGYLNLLRFFSMNIGVADYLFYIPIFIQVVYTLLKNNIDQIIDTQPLGTPAITQAIKWVTRITNKPLILEKIITELPTDKVHHFFKPIKRLNKTSRSYLKLITSKPLLNKNETADSFWKKNCALTEKEVCYTTFPLRPSFNNIKNHPPQKNKPMLINIHTYSKEEKFLITDTMKYGSLNCKRYPCKIIIPIDPKDKVGIILLGSQPNEVATLKYVKHYITMMSYVKKKENHLLFVFCNTHNTHKNSLLKKVHNLIKHTKNYPDQLSVIPMCYQEDSVIASLYYRSNSTFTRASGLTSMELMAVAQGQIWIHSETNPKNKNQLFKGMPIWERGNAYYLQEKKGAQFINPEMFLEVCKPYFFSPHSYASSSI